MARSSLKMKATGSADTKKRWRCQVCDYVMVGENPPKGCPKCGSSSREFLPDKEHTQLSYDGKKFDVLLINRSTHRSNNTGYMADLAEEELMAKGSDFAAST
jgi:rubredoxin